MKIVDYINESIKKKLIELDPKVKLKSYVQLPDGRKGYVKKFKIGDGDTMMAIVDIIEDGQTITVTVPADDLQKATMQSVKKPINVELNYVTNKTHWISAEILDKQQRTSPEAVMQAIDIFNTDNNPKGLPVEFTVFHRPSTLEEIKKLMSLGKYTAVYLGTNPTTNERGKFIINLQLENFTPEYADMMRTLFEEIDNESGIDTSDIDEDDSSVFTYYINLDERGSFYADVRNSDEETVFEISGFDIFEDGFMDDKNDMDGLHSHLVKLGIMAPGDKLVNNEEPRSSLRESKNIKQEIVKALEPIKIKIQSIK